MGAKVSTGGGGGKRNRAEVTADPNVIPFIDVMLVLLIIFMIAAPISSVDIEVDMPTSKIEPSKRPPRPTWISVSQGPGGIETYVMNDLVPIGELGERTYDAVKINSPLIANDDYEIKDQRIYIRADQNLEYRNVVRVMNRLQDKGFTKIGLVAEDRRR
ncbi:MAG TPA: biopolymer transporter ExbD [Vitreimonas sp.]|uniref:biopolymer transporter ExbD n=1 Tax=Vitreimonas sp. TaxID=3069702 RepID=UPI002D4DE0DD|nr:biopolymer transporter ExbD [Vitreimonas sp.]HYD89147.1 biopolymer transporter ExbD [Vitreimonas sp.]